MLTDTEDDLTVWFDCAVDDADGARVVVLRGLYRSFGLFGLDDTDSVTDSEEDPTVWFDCAQVDDADGRWVVAGLG